MKFCYFENDKEICHVSIENLWADVYGLRRSKSANVSPDIWQSLFVEAMAYAKTVNAKVVHYRLVESEDSDSIAEFLPKLGFTKKHDRIEFRADLKDLPDDSGTPLTWKTAAELNWTANEVAQFLKVVSFGDPDTDPSDDPLTYIQDWLNDPVLNAGLDCIAIGYLDEKPAAFVVAQVNPKTKWSRISYMGIVPQFRGQGLGLWVHRKGFSMMREQGGILYQGGTTTENHSMLRLFQKHGCKPYLRMEEWCT
jgi:hypothetical protein